MTYTTQQCILDMLRASGLQTLYAIAAEVQRQANDTPAPGALFTERMAHVCQHIRALVVTGVIEEHVEPGDTIPVYSLPGDY